MDVQIPIRGNLGNITHRVTAIKGNPETGAIVESLPSDTEFVGRYESTDVKSVNLLSKANVRVEGQTIVVNGNGLVQVYTLDGALVAKAEANGQGSYHGSLWRLHRQDEQRKRESGFLIRR